LVRRAFLVRRAADDSGRRYLAPPAHTSRIRVTDITQLYHLKPNLLLGAHLHAPLSLT
jgi:hypothetical protein